MTNYPGSLPGGETKKTDAIAEYARARRRAGAKPSCGPQMGAAGATWDSFPVDDLEVLLREP